jgi:epoxide hydrolase 4
MTATATTADSSAAEGTTDAVTHRRVNVGEVTLHVAEVRPSNKELTRDVPLVIFLHGFPEFWWSWRYQLAAMHKEGVWAVAPDLRGYNESDKPEGVKAYEVEKLADDVAGLIRALGREKAIVVGHDWGAMVAWFFAQFHQDMLEKLVIMNVPHPTVMQRHLMTSPRQLKKSWYIFFFQLPGIAERAMANNDFRGMRARFKKDGIPDQAIDRYIEALRVPNAMKSGMNYYRAAMRRVFTGKTPKGRVIEKPVLVIWGDQDTCMGKEMAEPPERFVKNARVVHIPDASHWVQTAAHVEVNGLLSSFISGGEN